MSGEARFVSVGAAKTRRVARGAAILAKAGRKSCKRKTSVRHRQGLQAEKRRAHRNRAQARYAASTGSWFAPQAQRAQARPHYKGVPIEKTYIPDFVCYDKIIVEIKAVVEQWVL